MGHSKKTLLGKYLCVHLGLGGERAQTENLIYSQFLINRVYYCFKITSINFPEKHISLVQDYAMPPEPKNSWKSASSSHFDARGPSCPHCPWHFTSVSLSFFHFWPPWILASPSGSVSYNSKWFQTHTKYKKMRDTFISKPCHSFSVQGLRSHGHFWPITLALHWLT